MSLPIVLAALLLALASPAAALAQGAGDEQYQDPFGGESQPSPTATPAPTRAPSAPTQSQSQPTPAPVPAPATTAAPAPSTPVQSAPSSARTLPYSGADVGLLALAGAALLAAGLALRRAVHQR